MPHHKLTTFIIAIILGFIACSERERLNPLDPKNPNTLGKVVGLSIYSELRNVSVSWHSVDISNILSYNIYRKDTNQDTFKLVGEVDKNKRTYVDRLTTYFVRYIYYVTARSADYESQPSDTISIIPGPSSFWVTDAYNYSIIKYSYDGKHVIIRYYSSGQPWAVAWNRYDRSLWYSDILLSQIYHRTSTETQAFYPTNERWDPRSIAIDESRNVLWIADVSGRLIRIISHQEPAIVEVKKGVIQPSAVSIDSRRHYCWIADPLAKSVLRVFTADTTIIPVGGSFYKPKAVSVNPGDGSCWVADSSRVVRLSINGNHLQTIEQSLTNAVNVAVDPTNNDIWVIDQTDAAGASRIIRFDSDGTNQVELDGFVNPLGITVDASTNDCIITDSGNGRIVRLAPDGSILSNNSDELYFPVSLAMDYTAQ